MVIGLASGVVAELLDGRLGYCLITPATGEIATVSVLVAAPWRPYLTLHAAQYASEKRIAMCTGIADILIVGIYAPHVGLLDMCGHVQWLIKAIKDIENTAAKQGASSIWISGDLNIRGLFPGTGRSPATGTSHAALSHTLGNLLKVQGLRPSAPVRHTVKAAPWTATTRT